MKKYAVLLMFGAALALRVGYSLWFPPAPVAGDSAQYDTIAWNLASGAGFSLEPGIPTSVRAPGYPFFLACVCSLFGHSLLAAVLAQALAGALVCLLVYDISKKLFDDRTAILAAWLTALFPVLIVYSGILLSETLFTLLFAVSVAAYVRSGDGEKHWPLALSGAALGLTTLTRATTILFPAGVLLALLVSGARRPLRKFSVSFLAFALVMLPWGVRNWRQFGVFLPVSTGGATCLYATGCMAEGGTYEQGFVEIAGKWEAFKASPAAHGRLDPDISFDKQLKREAVTKIKAHPAKYAEVILGRIPKYWLSSHSSVFGVDRPLGEYYSRREYLPILFRAAMLLFHGLVFLSMLLGLFYARGSYRKFSILPVIFLYFNMHIFFDLCPRYFVPIFPYMLIFASVTALELYSRRVPAAGR